jgi:hypothetical protein
VMVRARSVREGCELTRMQDNRVVACAVGHVSSYSNALRIHRISSSHHVCVLERGGTQLLRRNAAFIEVQGTSQRQLRSRSLRSLLG